MSKLSDFFKNCPVPRTPLTKEESDIMMRLLMNNAIKEPMTYEEFLNTPMVVENGGKEKLPTALMAIWLRNVRLNNHFKMSVDASLFLSTVIDSFGDGTLLQLCRQQGQGTWFQHHAGLHLHERVPIRHFHQGTTGEDVGLAEEQ